MRSHSAIFNLAATICGGGVLSLPYAIGQLGFVAGPLALAAVAVVTDASLQLLITAARRMHGLSYEVRARRERERARARRAGETRPRKRRGAGAAAARGETLPTALSGGSPPSPLERAARCSRAAATPPPFELPAASFDSAAVADAPHLATTTAHAHAHNTHATQHNTHTHTHAHTHAHTPPKTNHPPNPTTDPTTPYTQQQQQQQKIRRTSP